MREAKLRGRDPEAQQRVTGPLTANVITGYKSRHLIADVLGGSGSEDLVPMRAHVNNSWMGKLERKVRLKPRLGTEVYARCAPCITPRSCLMACPRPNEHGWASTPR
jgi:hypothetical protein